MPTMSIFLWRSLYDRLPLECKMQARDFELASICPNCKSDIESTSRLFIRCQIASQVWNFFAAQFHLNHPDTDELVHLLQFWFTSRNLGKILHVRKLVPLLIPWYIWCERNNVKYREKRASSLLIIDKIFQHIHRAQSQNLLGTTFWKGESEIAAPWGFEGLRCIIKQVRKVIWKRPQLGWLKLNCDGASKGNLGVAGAGGIDRNHDGFPLFAYFRYLRMATNVYIFVFAKGVSQLLIEVDVLVIINLLQGKNCGNWKLQQLITRFQYYSKHMSINISHIFREGNQITDFLVNHACTSLNLGM
ncbi:hypothetical protein Pfo_022556 [Paulownia fortunei]|nr:hypothetical protein Pfo_022556 [Paulownia fortunei]